MNMLLRIWHVCTMQSVRFEIVMFSMSHSTSTMHVLKSLMYTDPPSNDSSRWTVRMELSSVRSAVCLSHMIHRDAVTRINLSVHPATNGTAPLQSLDSLAALPCPLLSPPLVNCCSVFCSSCFLSPSPPSCSSLCRCLGFFRRFVNVNFFFGSIADRFATIPALQAAILYGVFKAWQLCACAAHRCPRQATAPRRRTSCTARVSYGGSDSTSFVNSASTWSSFLLTESHCSVVEARCTSSLNAARESEEYCPGNVHQIRESAGWDP